MRTLKQRLLSIIALSTCVVALGGAGTPRQAMAAPTPPVSCDVVLAQAHLKLINLQMTLNGLPVKIAAARAKLALLDAADVRITYLKGQLDVLEKSLPQLQSRLDFLSTNLNALSCASSPHNLHTIRQLDQFELYLQGVTDIIDTILKK